MKDKIKIRCQYSKKGLENFGKQKLGYYLGESKQGLYRIIWDRMLNIQRYDKDFIELNPKIELDENGEEILPEDNQQEAEITPEIIISIENALKKIKETGISQRGLEVLIKDYCGAEIKMSQIRQLIKAIENLKDFYFSKKN